jgi:preprotein translocase subunit SecG
MIVLFSILCILAAILMTLAVIIQNSKGGGLNSTFGGTATQILGVRRGNELIEKVTWGLAIVIGVLAIVANLAGNASAGDSGQLRMGKSIENQIIANPVSMPDPNSLAQPSAQPEQAPE